MFGKTRRFIELMKKGLLYENTALVIEVNNMIIVNSDIEGLISIQEVTNSGIKLYPTNGIKRYTITFLYDKDLSRTKIEGRTKRKRKGK